MPMLQVYQIKLLKAMDENGLDAKLFRALSVPQT